MLRDVYRRIVSLGMPLMVLLATSCGGGSTGDSGNTISGITPTPMPPPGPLPARTAKHVFVIAMENVNWTQPASFTLVPQILGNPAAPYINSLVTKGNANAAQVSFASNYHNVVVNGQTLHPSEPNYVWAEAGVTGPLDDADPYPANIVGAPNLSAALSASGDTWRSYDEDIDLATDASGNVTNTLLPQSQWTVPLKSFAGLSSAYTNPYNGSSQYDYAAKHNPQLFFAATNGGSASAADPTPSNLQATHYVPLQQLANDLAANNVAQYNWITPDEFNDMHSALTAGFTYRGNTYTGDEARIAQGDNFLSQVIPLIMGSAAYKDGGVIIIWTDETEGETVANRSLFSAMEIIVSPLAKGNAFSGSVAYDHSSDLLTMQRIFGLKGSMLGSAVSATDLSDLFLAGTVPAG